MPNSEIGRLRREGNTLFNRIKTSSKRQVSRFILAKTKFAVEKYEKIFALGNIKENLRDTKFAFFHSFANNKENLQNLPDLLSYGAESVGLPKLQKVPFSEFGS